MRQLLDAAVRTITVFGSPEEIHGVPIETLSGTTRRTSEFIRQLRRSFAAGNDERQARFHVRLQREQDTPAVYVDYADGPVVLQVASVPSTPNQVPPAESELKAKILDLEIVRSEFVDNAFRPALMLNVRSLEQPQDESSQRIASNAHAQIRKYAEWAKLKVIEVSSAAQAAEELEKL